MAAIVSSVFVLGHAQRDGSRYVTETHEWDTGERTMLEYGPIHTDKVNLQAIADARARQIEDERAASEMFQQERAAAEAKIATVLDAAVKTGALTDDDLKKLRLREIKDKVADVAVIEATL